MASTFLFRASLAACGIIALDVSPAQAVQKPEPPSCAAITFRALESGLSDGEQNAGLYRSRFGRIELKANAKNGVANDYYLFVNGKRPTALSGLPPQRVEACLKAKNIALPLKPMAGACTGERFRVVVDRAGAEKLAMLFGLIGKTWILCGAHSL